VRAVDKRPQRDHHWGGMGDRVDAGTGLRSPRTAVLVGLSLALYVGLNAWFYYDGFFRHRGAPLTFSPNAIYREIAPGFLSIIPWSRIPIILASCAALGWCVVAWWRGAAMARLGSCFVFYGLIAPQGTFLYWHLTGFGLLPRLPALVLSLVLAVAPALALGAPSVFARLTERERHLEWARLPFGRARLIGAGLLAAWLFFVSEAYLSRWDFIPSTAGLVAAWASLLVAPATLFGLLRLRTWSVFTLLFLALLIGAEIVACRSVAMASGYQEELGILAGWFGVGAAVAPLLLAAGLTAPFLRAAAARLRS
jgi:hypothetical protein